MIDTAKLTINGEAVIIPRFFTVTNPSTGEAAGQAPNADLALLNNAIDAAKNAFETWSQKSDHALQQACEAVALQIEKHSEELARLITLEQGKPLNGLSEIEDGNRIDSGGCGFARHSTVTWIFTA